MSVERIYRCDDCEGHAQTAMPPPHLPVSFIEVRRAEPDGEHRWHFCSWDCCMKFAAQQPLPEEVSGD